MRLEDIGFYTLSDARAKQASSASPIARAELIITDACNFRCPYCRGLRKELCGTRTFSDILGALKTIGSNGLINLRFSGGEPTLHSDLAQMVRAAKAIGVSRVAISTNGTARRGVYEQLIAAGADDFSVSLDACCSATADKMSGGCGSWQTVQENIAYLSARVYTTVGVVLAGENDAEAPAIVSIARRLGVHDVRLIPAAQLGRTLIAQVPMPTGMPILDYRLRNAMRGGSVRGLSRGDYDHCPLVLDDVAVANGLHFPCIIYMREGGDPIGNLSDDWRTQRAEWFSEHETHADSICSNNCLDVCRDYDNRWRALNPKGQMIRRIVEG